MKYQYANIEMEMEIKCQVGKLKCKMMIYILNNAILLSV